MILSALLGALLLQGPALAPANGADTPALDQKTVKAEKQHQDALKNDVDLGKKYSEEVEKQEKLSTNEEYIARVRRVGAVLAAVAQTDQVEVLWGDKRLNKFDYTFKVLQGTQVNAFSLPGGYIYVYEGLVKYAESDDELAGVLAHEIAHASFRHIDALVREQSKISTASIPLILAAILTGKPDVITGVIMGGQMVSAAFTSGWSVKAEKAADHGGFQYLLKTNYNPTGMLTFMERLAIDEHNNPAAQIDWGIYKSHPPGRERAEALTKDMERFAVPVQRSAVTTRFKTQVKPGEHGGVDIWFNGKRLYTFGGQDALRRADEAADRLNAFFDQVPAMFEVALVGQEIVGRRSVLIEVSPADAIVTNKPIDKLAQDTLRAIRGSMFSISWHVSGTG